MSKTHIGEACWYREFTEDGMTEWTGGRLLHWSTDYIELDGGPGLFPVGVVVDTQTHAVKSIYANQISFAATPGRD